VICEKEMYKENVEALAGVVGFHYLNHKIPAWVLTNFDTLLSRIKSLQEMRTYVETESFTSLTKKEQSMKKRSLAKIEKVYKGVVSLRKRPDLVIIVDGQMMHKFVEEVEKLTIPAIILASSNFDMWTKAHKVLCNVNSQQSIDFVLKNISMVEMEKWIDWLIDESYVPSSVERKKAVLMYFFVWIVLALSKEKASVYEFFHLKQALWRWMVFFFTMMFSLIFIFIPYMRVLPILVFLGFMVVWVLFVKQAYEWRYVVDDDKVILPFYAGLGWRVVSIFELDIYDPDQ